MAGAATAAGVVASVCSGAVAASCVLLSEEQEAIHKRPDTAAVSIKVFLKKYLERDSIAKRFN